MNFNLSDKERAFGERLRADAWRAMKETDARTRNRQNDVTKKLGTAQWNIIEKATLSEFQQSMMDRKHCGFLMLIREQVFNAATRIH